MRRSKGAPPPRRGPVQEPLDNGQRVRNCRTQQEGVVLDHACQYAHPKADPVYSYLIRFDDGQVLAITQAALSRDGGYELVED